MNNLHNLCYKDVRSEIVIRVGKLLIDAGVDINAKKRDGWNALHILCRTCNDPDLYAAAEFLITSGIDVNTGIGNYNWTALHLLCRYYSAEGLKNIIELLIKAGAKVNVQDAELLTPTHLLCRYGKASILRDSLNLLSQCPEFDINAKDIDNQSILDYLCCNSTNMNLSDLISMLLESHGSRFKVSVDETILFAARAGCLKTVRCLAPFVKCNVFDFKGKCVSDYLDDFAEGRAYCTCLCCRYIENSKELEIDFSAKEKRWIPRTPFDRDRLESKILDFDESTYISQPNQGTVQSLSSNDSWNRLVDSWNSNQNIDLPLFLQYLSSHSSHPGLARCVEPHCDWCSVPAAIKRFANKLVESAAQLDPRFAVTRLIEYGSSAEGSKIILPDEYDFMVALEKFTEAADNNLEVSYAGSPEDGKVFLNSKGFISSRKLIRYYFELLREASDLLDEPNIFVQEFSYGDTCVTMDLICGRKAQESLQISVDITTGVLRNQQDLPTVKFPPWFSRPEAEEMFYLVPDRKLHLSNWRMSFPVLEREAVRQAGPSAVNCYKLMKVLALVCNSASRAAGQVVSRKTEPSSYALKTCFLKHLASNPDMAWQDSDLASHCAAVCQTYLEVKTGDLYSFFNPGIAVYRNSNGSRLVIEQLLEKLERIP